MSSIRKTKKTMKKSNGSFKILVDNMVFDPLDWGILKYHRHGISLGMSEYLPYKIIKKIIV